jgi:hypothetical protein
MMAKEPEVTWSDQVKAKADADPDVAEALRDFGAVARQVMEGVQSGKYPSFDEAMFILTGSRPEKLTSEEAEEYGVTDVILLRLGRLGVWMFLHWGAWPIHDDTDLR